MDSGVHAGIWLRERRGGGDECVVVVVLLISGYLLRATWKKVQHEDCVFALLLVGRRVSSLKDLPFRRCSRVGEDWGPFRV